MVIFLNQRSHLSKSDTGAVKSKDSWVCGKSLDSKTYSWPTQWSMLPLYTGLDIQPRIRWFYGWSRLAGWRFSMQMTSFQLSDLSCSFQLRCVKNIFISELRIIMLLLVEIVCGSTKPIHALDPGKSVQLKRDWCPSAHIILHKDSSS